MCGICGYAGFDPDEALLGRQAGLMTHRGPDDEGFFRRDRVGLGVRRLSIIDPAGGHQPLFNVDRSIALVGNGEIYNYRDLAADLAWRGHRFQTRSDVETIVHLYEEHGVDCLRYLRDMFAFALYDAAREQLFLARDRLGIKPLYYWLRGGKLIFGSEIKAILACDEVPRVPSLAAIDAYLSLRYVPGPGTLFEGIHKLPAGHWLTLANGQARVERYWEPSFRPGPDRPDRYYQERFAELFAETVRLHLVSDAPVGAFLSGGLDSSAIVAAMHTAAGRPVRTFSVGFDWPGDELPAAREVAQRLGCDHHEVICRPADIALLPKVVWHLDEPIGDAIVLPMYLLSQLARRHVKVVLTGEGGDEVLAGYLFHKVMYWAGRYARWTPRLARECLITPLVAKAPAALLNRAFDYPARLGDRGRRKVLDYLALVGDDRPDREYRFLVSLFDWRDKAALYVGELKALHSAVAAVESASPAAERNGRGGLPAILALQYADWLPDDILMKLDKTTMAGSVEGRVPFLDHEFVDFLGQVPSHLKLRGWTDKVLLRRYLAEALPGDLARRPKRPFYLPLDRYFATPAWQELVETCLSEASVRRRGYFAWPAVQRLRQSVGAGDFLYGKQVLSLVMLEIWHRLFIDGESGWVS